MYILQRIRADRKLPRPHGRYKVQLEAHEGETSEHGGKKYLETAGLAHREASPNLEFVMCKAFLSAGH